MQDDTSERGNRITVDLFRQYFGLRRENYILVIGRMMTHMGAMVFPILTLILTQKMGFSATAAASVMTLSGILMVPAGMLGGKVTDMYNKRWIIIILDMISVVLYITSAFIPLTKLTIFFLITASIAQHMEHPAYNALVADITPTADRERAFSLQYLAVNLGLVASPTLAGFLFRSHLWLCFLINGLSILSSTLLILFFMKDITPVKNDEVNNDYQVDRHEASLWTILKENRLMWLFVYIHGVYSATYQAYNYLVPLDLASLHGDQGALIYGSMTSVACVVVVVFTPIFTRVFMNRPQTYKITIGEIFELLGYVIFIGTLMVAPTPMRIPGYYLAVSVFTFGEILETIVNAPYLSARIPASHRGRINGFETVVANILQSVVLMLTGMIYDNVSRNASWYFTLIFLMTGILGSFLLIRRDREEYPGLYE